MLHSVLKALERFNLTVPLFSDPRELRLGEFDPEKCYNPSIALVRATTQSAAIVLHQIGLDTNQDTYEKCLESAFEIAAEAMETGDNSTLYSHACLAVRILPYAGWCGFHLSSSP